MYYQLKGEVLNLRHESLVLCGNPAGDPHVRDLVVYLPPGYGSASQRFPVVYCLTGFGGRGKMLTNDSAFTPNLPERVDKLISAGRIPPIVVVMPNCFTRFGGSQYINSTATGPYEDYLTGEIVPYIDSQLHTINDRFSRAVMGISSGGYGSLIMGMRHADLFGLVCSISGDAYFEHCYIPDFLKAFRALRGQPERFLNKLRDVEKKGKTDFSGLNIIGMSACYSPSGSGFDLPFDLETGEIRQDVWERWLAHDPVRLAARYADKLRSLRLLFLDAGTRDEFGLDLGARILAKKFKELSVPHMHEEFDDGHFSISYRYERSLELIAENIVV